MTWENLQDNWQHTATAALSPTVVRDTVRRSLTLRLRLLWRDGIESVIALALVPVAIGWALTAAHADKTLSALSFALLAVLFLFEPWYLWRVRRLLPRSDFGLPLSRFLELDRAAMLAQARMLETVARWYLAPFFVAFTGVILGDLGPTRKAFAILALVLLVCVILNSVNGWAARRIFRRRIADIDAQQHELAALETTPTDISSDNSSQTDLPHAS